MNPSALIKFCLAILAIVTLSVGLPAAFAPESFYENYPFVLSWVDLLPPYNEHLVTDVGGLYLGFGLLFVWALAKPSRQLILPLCVAWLVVAALHFAFHISHLEGFSTRDAVAQGIGLALVVLVPMVPIVILGRRRI